MRFRYTLPALALLAASVLSCHDDKSPTGPTESVAAGDLTASVTVENGGNGYFAFLPPLALDGERSGEFDASFLNYLRVEVCEWSGSDCIGAPVAVLTADAKPASAALRLDPDANHYVATWQANHPGDYYVRVLVRDVEFGGTQVHMAQRKTVPIKFWIRMGIPAAAVVAPHGGQVLSDDGRLVLNFPAGAIAGPTLITVTQSNAVPPAIFPVSSLGTSYELKPHGLQFNAVLQGAFDYSGLTGAPSVVSHPVIVHWSEDGTLGSVLPSADNPATNVLNFDIGSFSLLAPALADIDVDWAVFKVRWVTPDIKWYLRPPGPDCSSFLSRDALSAQLAKWQAEQGYFVFSEASSETEANIVFDEACQLAFLLDDTACSLGFNIDSPNFPPGPHDLVRGVTCFGFLTNVSNLLLGRTDQVFVRIASETITARAQAAGVSPESMAGMVLLHETGHALGIAHPNSRDQVPVMGVFNLLPLDLHPWDIAALRYHYGPPITPPTSAFDFALDRLQVAGNIVSGFTDEFDDGSTGVFPTSELACMSPVSEANGFLQLTDQDGAQSTLGGIVLVDNCVLGFASPTTRIRDGAGDASVTATFRADVPGQFQTYGIHIFSSGGDLLPVSLLGTGERVELVVFNTGTEVALQVSYRSSSGASYSNSRRVSMFGIDPQLNGIQTITLRFDVSDVDNSVTASFSVDGGQVFYPIPVAVVPTLFTSASEALVAVFGWGLEN